MKFIRLFFGDDGPVLRRANLQVILLATVITPMGSTLVSPILESLTGPFGVSIASVSLLISVYTAPGIVFIPLAGVLADRFGRKPIVLVGLLAFGLGGIAISLTTSFSIVLGLRFVQGLGFSFVLPTLITAIGDMYDGTKEATAHGLRITAVGVSNLVFPPLAGMLVVVAWQYSFLLYAAALPIAALVAVAFDETTPGASVTDDAEVASNDLRADVRELVGRRDVLAVLAGRTVPTAVWLGFLTVNSVLAVTVFESTPRSAGLMVSFASVAFALTASQIGRINIYIGDICRSLLAGHLVMGGGFALVALAPSIQVALIGVTVCGAGFGWTSSMYRTLLTSISPPHLRGSTVSLGEGVARVTATVVPIMLGVLISLLTVFAGAPGAVRAVSVALGASSVAAGAACILALSAMDADI